tara:strand:+ start:755 stop:1510 length:756 start_codon:yes stop_codon:yes gene_type:complete
MKVSITARHKDLQPILDTFTPQLSNRFLPDWYKKQNLQWDFWDEPPSAKRCPGIRDYMTDGIIIPAWSDMHFLKNENGDVKWNITVANNPAITAISENMGKFQWVQHQHHEQTVGMELNEVKNYGTLKLISPFLFHTEPGYGLEFSDPFYHHRRDIKVLPGKIETDIWHEVNFPFEFYDNVNNFHRHALQVTAGEPLIMVRPYKIQEDKRIELVTEYNIDIVETHKEQSVYYFGIGNDWKRYRNEKREESN